MNYSIDILKKEAELLSKCLSEWETLEYPDAKKERDKRLKEINTAIHILETKSIETIKNQTV